MEYLESIRSCDTLDELFSLWKNKPLSTITYSEGKQEISKHVNHQQDIFIADGIVNTDVWNSGNKKILYVLKEAYGDDWGELTLATWLQLYHPQSRIWKRIARWTYGIQNTSASETARYIPNLSKEAHNGYLDRIAVINLKKSGGKSNSNYSEISAYARLDKEEIKKEFSLIDADVIVCGSTFKTLLTEVFEKEPLNGQNSCDNWYYYMNLDGKERLYIDMYHPANQWPDLLNYYALVSIYQQALISRRDV